MGALPVVVAAIGLLGAAGTARAHGAGGHYALPLPFWVYLIGMAGLVVAAFVVTSTVGPGRSGRLTSTRVPLLCSPVGCLCAHPVVLGGLRLLAVGLLGLLILAGLLGHANPARNLAPTFVWSVGWVGLAYVSALVGNIWALLNPWQTLFDRAERLYSRLTAGRQLARHWPYPGALGAWPGVLLLLLFAWIELALQGAAVPAGVAGLLLAYSVLTWAGMFLFGTHVWLKHGDVCTMVFGLLARFAPTEVRVRAPHLCRTCPLDCQDRDGACIDCYACFARAEAAQRECNLRPYAVGLARQVDVSLAQMMFVLVLLAAIAFDAVLGTSMWMDVEHSLRDALAPWGSVPRALPRTLGLLGCVLALLEVYVLVSVVMARASGGGHTGASVAPAFACTLVPVAIALHVAHYLPFLLTQGQALIPLLSDPFGYGWNLLGTATYEVQATIVGAPFAWYTVLLALGAGYCAAVALAYHTALRRLRSPVLARRSQYPLLTLLTSAAVLSLWLLTQPILGDGEESTPTTVEQRGPCQGFVVLPDGSAVLRGPDHSAGAGSPAQRTAYRQAQGVPPGQNMLCVPFRDLQTTAWAATSGAPGLHVTINSLSGVLTASAAHPAGLEITLWDSRQGAPVDDATVHLLARMPQHDPRNPGGHGPGSPPHQHGLAASPAGRGRYIPVGLHFTAPGAWLITLQIQRGGQTQLAYFAPLVSD